jgi:hypothetical protein
MIDSLDFAAYGRSLKRTAKARQGKKLDAAHVV